MQVEGIDLVGIVIPAVDPVAGLLRQIVEQLPRGAVGGLQRDAARTEKDRRLESRDQLEGPATDLGVWMIESGAQGG